MPCQVEGMRIGIPSLAHGIDLAALDLDRFEQALLDGDGGARQRRHDNGVKAAKPGLYLAVELRSREQRAAHRLRRRIFAKLHLLEQRRAEPVAPLPQQVAKA